MHHSARERGAWVSLRQDHKELCQPRSWFLFHPIREQAVLALPIAERRLQLPPHPQPLPPSPQPGNLPTVCGSCRAHPTALLTGAPEHRAHPVPDVYQSRPESPVTVGGVLAALHIRKPRQSWAALLSQQHTAPHHSHSLRAGWPVASPESRPREQVPAARGHSQQTHPETQTEMPAEALPLPRWARQAQRGPCLRQAATSARNQGS